MAFISVFGPAYFGRVLTRAVIGVYFSLNLLEYTDLRSRDVFQESSFHLGSSGVYAMSSKSLFLVAFELP
jgi:hypothetical protein